MQTENGNRRAWLAAARRTLVLDTPQLDCPLERADARKDAGRHVQQASLLAMRAGRKDAANALLAAWEQLESGK